MVRGTTPTFQLTLTDQTVDLTQAEHVYATFKQLNTTITKTGEDLTVTPHEVDVYLSQEDTLKFLEKEVEVQLNWTYYDGRRACSKVKTVNVDRNLEGRVLQ